MKKVSQSELKQMQRAGAKVTRTPPPPKPAPKVEPKPREPEEFPASMRGSMKFFEQQAEATRQLIAHNAAVVASFRDELKTLVESQRPQEPVPYTFEMERGKDGLLTKVYAIPGIDE